jgi:hypothetical protein
MRITAFATAFRAVATPPAAIGRTPLRRFHPFDHSVHPGIENRA